MDMKELAEGRRMWAEDVPDRLPEPVTVVAVLIDDFSFDRVIVRNESGECYSVRARSCHPTREAAVAFALRYLDSVAADYQRKLDQFTTAAAKLRDADTPTTILRPGDLTLTLNPDDPESILSAPLAIDPSGRTGELTTVGA